MISLSSGYYVLFPQGPKVYQNTEMYFTWGPQNKKNISAKNDALEICSK